MKRNANDVNRKDEKQLDQVLQEQHAFRGQRLIDCLPLLKKYYGHKLAKIAVARIERNKDVLSPKDALDLADFKRSLDQP